MEEGIEQEDSILHLQQGLIDNLKMNLRITLS